jgi:hypothetical protein
MAGVTRRDAVHCGTGQTFDERERDLHSISKISGGEEE